MLIGNDVQADSVHANLGFFGDRLLVGGTEAEPINILEAVTAPYWSTLK